MMPSTATPKERRWRIMPIYHRNPTCDTCGRRHEVGHTSECLDCVLASTSEDIADLRKELAASEAEVERLKSIIRDDRTAAEWTDEIWQQNIVGVRLECPTQKIVERILARGRREGETEAAKQIKNQYRVCYQRRGYHVPPQMFNHFVDSIVSPRDTKETNDGTT